MKQQNANKYSQLKDTCLWYVKPCPFQLLHFLFLIITEDSDPEKKSQKVRWRQDRYFSSPRWSLWTPISTPDTVDSIGIPHPCSLYRATLKNKIAILGLCDIIVIQSVHIGFVSLRNWLFNWAFVSVCDCCAVKAVAVSLNRKSKPFQMIFFYRETWRLWITVHRICI